MRIAALSAVLALCAGLAFAQQKTPAFWDAEWPDTDFSKSSVSFVEILSGGPPKDGIPALDSAQFVPVSEDSAIPEMEPVVTVELEGELPRAYPIRYLTWHEIVNDRIGDVPVSVTFCPLCNSALVFDGRYEGRELTFGVSGKLRNSDMVMYDRQTESWWQQFDGEAIVGELLGAELTQVPGWMESLGEFRARNPEGLLMVIVLGRWSVSARRVRFWKRGCGLPGRIQVRSRLWTSGASPTARMLEQCECLTRQVVCRLFMRSCSPSHSMRLRLMGLGMSRNSALTIC